MASIDLPCIAGPRFRGSETAHSFEGRLRSAQGAIHQLFWLSTPHTGKLGKFAPRRHRPHWANGVGRVLRVLRYTLPRPWRGALRFGPTAPPLW